MKKPNTTLYLTNIKIMIVTKTELKNSSLIIFSIIFDLFFTYQVVDDFKNQEMNIIVRIFKLTFFQFAIFNILFSFFLSSIYVYSLRNSLVFKIKTNSLKAYIKNLMYKDGYFKIFDFIFKLILLYGLILPIYIFITTCIFTINNIWVYLYLQKNDVAVHYYKILDSFCFFYFIIYALPILVLIYLFYYKLRHEYLKYNIISS